MNISTRQLRAFIALAEGRNFTRAASVCHLSQSAFSALIRQLEESLEVRLFDRSTRHVEPTADGTCAHAIPHAWVPGASAEFPGRGAT